MGTVAGGRRPCSLLSLWPCCRPFSLAHTHTKAVPLSFPSLPPPAVSFKAFLSGAPCGLSFLPLAAAMLSLSPLPPCFSCCTLAHTWQKVGERRRRVVCVDGRRAGRELCGGGQSPSGRGQQAREAWRRGGTGQSESATGLPQRLQQHPGRLDAACSARSQRRGGRRVGASRAAPKKTAGPGRLSQPHLDRGSPRQRKDPQPGTGDRIAPAAVGREGVGGSALILPRARFSSPPCEPVSPGPRPARHTGTAAP